MAKDPYELPAQVALSLVTERVEFLKMAPIETMSNHDVRQLLSDLIQDRWKLRREVQSCIDQLSNLRGLAVAVEGKYQRLLDTLDGRETVDKNQDIHTDL